jgi:hypothetical protein
MGAPVLPLVTLYPNSNAYPAGRHLGDSMGLSHVNTDLITDNVRAGINIFGVIGNMDYYQRYIGASLYQSVLASKVTVSRNIAKTKALASVPLYALTDDPTDLIRVSAPTMTPSKALLIVTAPDSVTKTGAIGSAYATSVA